MPRESKITYEMVRDAANAFLVEHDRMPTNKEIHQDLGGASDIISRCMKLWREDVRARKPVAQLDVPQHLIKAYSAEVANRVDERTCDLVERIKEAEADADNLRNDLGRTREELTEVEIALNKSRDSVITLETQLNDARIEAHRIGGELSRSSGETSRLHKQVGALEAELSTERLKGSRLEQELALALAAKTDLAAKVAHLEFRLQLF